MNAEIVYLAGVEGITLYGIWRHDANTLDGVLLLGLAGGNGGRGFQHATVHLD